MSYLYAILVLRTLYVTTPRSIICEKYRILMHLFTYSKQTYKCQEFFFITLSTHEVKWSVAYFIFQQKKSFSWTVFVCFHYTKIKFKAWQIYYIKKWWIIPVQYLPIGRNSTWYSIFTIWSKAINSWKRTLCVTHCYVINKHSTENSFANLGIHWTLHHYTLYFLHLLPRPFRVSWKPIKSVKIQYV